MVHILQLMQLFCSNWNSFFAVLGRMLFSPSIYVIMLHGDIGIS
jgi:uncharacterized membrane protein YgdD (TMEM256/DUF423 family)